MSKNTSPIENIRHSLAHLLAAAVRELYPGAQNAIGPAIEHGFYQDFELPKPVTDADLPKIEKKMRELLPTWKNFERREVTPAEARKEFSWNKYKLEMIEDLAREKSPITFYTSGSLIDLCRGGHAENPAKEIKPDSFRLSRVAGAYWRGDEKNPMLTRIYGLAFATKQELDQHLKMLEEAAKRDHRKLGTQLDLFTISDQVGKGLPLFTPKGALLRELLTEYSQGLLAARGWQKVWSPHITKNDLYKTSGHWDKFGAELFLVKSQETADEMVMKPMNCPHHQQIYASRPHSYRELPIKYMETTTIYRDEKAGELLGLSRVRSVTQDDSHTFCTPDQIEDIFQDLIEVTKIFYETIGMKIRARLSFRDSSDKYLGEPKLWDKAQDILLKIAKNNKLEYFVAEGEAAFYGPKIDFMATDAIGREWQLATPQLDFVQPKRFGLTYTDHKGQGQTPVMIHFALMGSIERFLSVYIEHTAGAFPLWLAPIQVIILPISDEQNKYAQEVATLLSPPREGEIERGLASPSPSSRGGELRVEIDMRSESIGKKIREAEKQKIPYMLIIGKKEVEAGTISVRQRGEKDLGSTKLDKFIEKIQKEIETKSL